jgi:hypothetical protein
MAERALGYEVHPGLMNLSRGTARGLYPLGST